MKETEGTGGKRRMGGGSEEREKEDWKKGGGRNSARLGRERERVENGKK